MNKKDRNDWRIDKIYTRIVINENMNEIFMIFLKI